MKHLSLLSIVARLAIIAIFIVGIVQACANKPKPKNDVPDTNVGEIKTTNPGVQMAATVIDTFCMHMRMQDSLLIVSLNEQLTEVVMQLNAAAYQNEMLKKRADSLRAYVALGNFKMNRLKYYINIVVKNNSQIKFLKGWSNRVDSITIKDLPK